MFNCRLVILLSGLLCAAVGYAGEGFYVGAGASYNQMTYDFNAVDFSFITESNINAEKNSARDQVMGGQLVAGHTWLIMTDNLYFVSLEGFADFYSVEAQKSWSFTFLPIEDEVVRDLSATLKNSYGLVIKPGVFLSNNLNVFMQAGFAFSQLRDMVYDKGANNLPVNENHIKLADKDLWGYRLGAGIQYLITKNLTAELAWTLTFYDNFTTEAPTSFGNQNDPTAPGSMVTVDYSGIRTNQVFLQFDYYFDS